MIMVFIDYPHLSCASIAKTGVPSVISGKFVQIRNEAVEYLVFSPKEFAKYHADIIKRFCLDKRIEGGYDSERKRYVIDDRAWVIVGGGKFEMDAGKRAVRLYDNSMAYGKFDVLGLREKILSLREFSAFTVGIE
jgi:hypothetical protein